MTIHNNLPALFAHRQMVLHQNIAAKSLMRLSSGYRINSAADDPAGLAISEGMRSQIRGLRMASQNAQQTVSMLQTADGGLHEVHAMLQRMRELATQAASDTYSDFEREQLNKEYTALLDEVDHITRTTNYNGVRLLDGSTGGKSGQQGLEHLGLSQISSTGSLSGTGKINLQVDESGAGIAALRINGQLAMTRLDHTGTATFRLQDGNTVSLSFQPEEILSGVITGLSFRNGALRQDQLMATTTQDQLAFQVGANGTADSKVLLRIRDCASDNLGELEQNNSLRDTNLLTRENAAKALESVRKAVDQISGTRGDIGAQLSRLEHQINNLENTADNLTEAESRIRDVDMAEEMMTFTKHNMLAQVAQTMLAHANQMPNAILELLKSM